MSGQRLKLYIHMGKRLLCLLAIFLPILTFAQVREASPRTDESVAIAKNFIQEIADMDVALDVILSEHVIVRKPNDELYDYLEASLQEIRINLLSKNIDEIQYKRYNELPRKEVRDIDPEGMLVENMVFLYHKNRLLTSLYIEDGKIASFTLVSKGNELAHFVTY